MRARERIRQQPQTSRRGLQGWSVQADIDVWFRFHFEHGICMLSLTNDAVYSLTLFDLFAQSSWSSTSHYQGSCLIVRS